MNCGRFMPPITENQVLEFTCLVITINNYEESFGNEITGEEEIKPSTLRDSNLQSPDWSVGTLTSELQPRTQFTNEGPPVLGYATAPG